MSLVRITAQMACFRKHGTVFVIQSCHNKQISNSVAQIAADPSNFEQ